MSSTSPRLRIAIVGAGISGLTAAWLLSQRHEVTVYERARRIGGHANTVLTGLGGSTVPVDTGFIVFNRPGYPGLSALFDWLGVPTRPTEMSFGVSMDGGALEYSGSGPGGLLGQPRNLIRPRFWSMLADLARFYREASRDADAIDDLGLTLGDYLARGRYGAAFRDDHLLPMAGAVWSAAPAEMLSYPAAAFIRFHLKHGLLQLRNRPTWRTVVGGSAAYVDLLTSSFADRIRVGTGVRAVRRLDGPVEVTDSDGNSRRFDHVVMACHADEALTALADPSPTERSLLGAFRYSRNLAVLHSDPSFMPRRRAVWSSWNYVGSRTERDRQVCVTYWMNRLQGIESEQPLLVTLNPSRTPRGEILHSEVYWHPLFDSAALHAQRRLGLLQGTRNTWFCGAHLGSGFHEDGFQSGLSVADLLGVRPPWVARDGGEDASGVPVETIAA